MASTDLPRWSLAALSGLIAAILGWAASVLPWRSWTTFAVITAVVAVVHAATAITAAAGSGRRRSAWRIQAMVALAYLAYLTWGLVWSATYVAALYGGLGRGVAAGLAVCWGVVVLITVPVSVWGIAATGGLRARRRAAQATGLLVLLCGAGLARASTAPGAEPWPVPDLEVAHLVSQPWLDQRPAKRASLMVETAVECDRPPGADLATAVVTIRERRPRRAAVHCLQGTPTEVTAALGELIGSLAARAPVKIDLVRAGQPLRAQAPMLDALMLRPGLDGVCLDRLCLMPWQLVANDQFTTYKPLPVIDDLTFGVDPAQLRRKLQPGQDRWLRSIEGLVRIETTSLVLDVDGRLHQLERMREPQVALDAETLREAVARTEAYVVSAQAEDGRFRYKLDPFTGRVSFRGFAVPRQAGTTLSLCDLGSDSEPVRSVVRASLDMLAGIEHRSGDFSGLSKRRNAKRLALGPTALSLIAFASCRDRVGPVHDELMGRMAKFLMAMQRPDGGFHPRFDLASGAPVPGPDPLYAGGQVVFALTLLERILGQEHVLAFPPVEQLRDAVERAMVYFAGPYWDHFGREFFYIEENWHCMAARASLGHHRNAAYEQFCIDYITFKSRLILDEHARVSDDLVGGYGFGNVLLPHNTGTSGFGEALAAAMAVKRARGMDLDVDRRTMELALRFLLRHQWSPVSCFACTDRHRVVGAFSEHMGSPQIRIDYAQHALAAMGHGGRMLGLLPDPS